MKERAGKTKTDDACNKQSVFLPSNILAELHREARRQNRSQSWLMQRAWKIARTQIMATPGDPVMGILPPGSQAPPGDGTAPDPAPPKPRPPVTRPHPSPPPTPDPKPRPQPAPPAAAPSGQAPPPAPRVPVFDDFEGHDHDPHDPYHLAGRRFGVF